MLITSSLLAVNSLLVLKPTGIKINWPSLFMVDSMTNSCPFSVTKSLVAEIASSAFMENWGLPHGPNWKPLWQLGPLLWKLWNQSIGESEKALPLLHLHSIITNLNKWPLPQFLPTKLSSQSHSLSSTDILLPFKHMEPLISQWELKSVSWPETSKFKVMNPQLPQNTVHTWWWMVKKQVV